MKPLLSSRQLLALYLVLALAPLAIAALTLPREREWIPELATGMAMTGYAMLLLQFLSTGRFEAMSGGGGIDRTMRFHQLAAVLAAIFVLLHPVLPRLARAENAADALDRLVMLFTLPSMFSGVIAWLALLAMVIHALLRRRTPARYETWRGLHLAAALVVAVGGAHHVFAVGNYAAHPAMRAYWWALLALALGAVATIYGVRPWLARRQRHVLVANRELTPGVRELEFEPRGGPGLRPRAGQFAWINFASSRLPLFDHPFSISSAPSEAPRLRFTIKALGDFTRELGRVAPGTPALIDGPHGDLVLEGREGEAVLLVAGGIGIAAIIGLARALDARDDPRPVSVLYGAHDRGRLVYADELRAIAERRGWRLRLHLDQPPPDWEGARGGFNREAYREAIAERPAADWLCLACGPTPMLLAAERDLLTLGVAHDRIVYERFDYD